MPEQEITVSVNGTDYFAWKAADVVCSMDAVCGAFNVELSAKRGELDVPREIKPGSACQVFADGEPVVTGYVDKVSPSIDAENHTVIISGRDKTSDIVDCSAEIPSFEVYNVTMDTFVRMLCEKFGIQVKVETDVGKPFDRIAIEPGEKCLDCIAKLAKKRGILCTTDGEGAFVLSARGDFSDSGAAVREGENLESGTAIYDFSDRFSHYTTHGQMPSFFNGAQEPVHDQVGSARDKNLMRYRPLLLNCEMWANLDDARIRAENECAFRAGSSTRVNVQVTGWRHAGGALWRPRQLVTVDSESLYLDNTELVISAVRYSFRDSDGTISELEMTRPDAYLKDCSGQVEDDPYELS